MSEGFLLRQFLFGSTIDQINFLAMIKFFCAVSLVAVHRRTSFSFVFLPFLSFVFISPVFLLLLCIFAVERLYWYRAHVVFAFVIHMTTQFYKQDFDLQRYKMLVDRIAKQKYKKRVQKSRWSRQVKRWFFCIAYTSVLQ